MERRDRGTDRPRGQIAVVGAGIIGLSTALIALRRGFGVTVYSDRDPFATTSARAAASFKPRDVAVTDLTARLLERSWAEFERVAASGTGVRLHTHWEAGSSEIQRPWYVDVVRDATPFTAPDVPGGYHSGWAYGTWFVDMPVYLRWLVAELHGAGGAIVVLAEPFRSRAELLALPGDVVINCTGMGSRSLFDDDALIGIKGQVVLVPPQPEMDWSISADGFYVYPRSGETVLGGTAERGVDDETVDPVAVELIVRANRRILPGLVVSDAIGAVAGVRPFREGSIRIERDPQDSRLIHNYGHGGAGITLSWGSAEEAIGLI